MDDNKMHGKIFKQIREGRGVKLKDAAGDAISVRTLIRFEADETSVSLEIFEQLLRNIGISYHDYFSEYIPLAGFDISEFLREVRNLDTSGSTSAIRSLAVKSLQKDKISMNERLYIDQIISISGDLEGPKIIKENREIVLNHLRSLDSHNSNEMLTLTFMLRTSTAEEFSDDFIRRVIEENMKPVTSDSIFSVDRSERSLILVHGAVALLSRRGFVEEAEERCIEESFLPTGDEHAARACPVCPFLLSWREASAGWPAAFLQHRLPKGSHPSCPISDLPASSASVPSPALRSAWAFPHWPNAATPAATSFRWTSFASSAKSSAPSRPTTSSPSRTTS